MELLSSWSKVLGKFTRSKKPGASADPAGQQLSRPEQIAKVFKHLCDNHKLLTVTVPPQEGSFTSTILKFDQNHRLIFMDELTPRTGHEQAERERKFRVRTFLNGVELGFLASIREIRQESDGAIYTIPFPELLRYKQRRSHFRAQLGLSQNIPVYLENPYGGLLQGKLRNISLGGIGVELNRAIPADFEFKDKLTSCTIQLQNGKRLHSDLEIRFTGKPGAGRTTHIGGRFIDLSKPSQKMVCHFVAKMDRERRKKEQK